MASNGDLDVTETLTVNFPFSGKHGIFRFFDAVDDSAPNARRVPTDLQVGRDGEGEQADLSTEESGRFTVLRIGSPDVTLEPGLHTYVISYHIDGVLEPGKDFPTQFYWDLIPGGWQQSIESADLTVNLPAEAQGVRCAQGFGAGDGCTATGEGTRTVNVQTQNLPPHTPVTVQIGLDMPTPPPGKTLPWTARFDPVLGHSLPLAVAILLLALIGGLVGFAAGLRSREPKPPYPLQYVPPPGIGPAQGAYIFTEQISRTAYVASIMEAAEKGAVDLARDGTSWTLVDKQGEAGWAKTDEITARIGRLVGGPGGCFTTASGDVDSGEKLQSQIASFDFGDQGLGQPSRSDDALGHQGPGRRARGGGLRAGLRDADLVSVRHHRAGVDPGTFRDLRTAAALGRFGNAAYDGRPGALVEGRRLPPSVVNAIKQGAVRLLRPPGRLHDLPSVGGGPGLRGRMGQEVPHGDGHGTTRTGVLRGRLFG